MLARGIGMLYTACNYRYFQAGLHHGQESDNAYINECGYYGKINNHVLPAGFIYLSPQEIELWTVS